MRSAVAQCWHSTLGLVPESFWTIIGDRCCKHTQKRGEISPSLYHLLPPDDSTVPLLLSQVLCVFVQVPAVRANTVATINMTIQGESDSMNKKTKILIEPPHFIHIIQTDKPIYKPGQIGKDSLDVIHWARAFQDAAALSECSAQSILSALLTNSAELAKFRTILEYLHNAELLLDNFRNCVYILLPPKRSW